MDRLPIVYCRGYAGPSSQIDGTVDDPFYGFNDGATHVRVDGDGDPMFYQFEGPLLRLLTEQGYQFLVHGDQKRFLETTTGPLSPQSIWVHRFYDQFATTFSPQPKRNLFEKFGDMITHHLDDNGFDIERAATELYDLVSDPFELQNVAGDPQHAARIAGMAARLRELRPNWPVDSAHRTRRRQRRGCGDGSWPEASLEIPTR